MATTYGESVRRYRIAAGLTQEELAALSGLDVRTISDIERGRTGRPHRNTIDLLARVLDRDELAYEVVRAHRLARAGAGAGESVGAGESAGARPPETSEQPGRPAWNGGPASARTTPVVEVYPVAIGHYADPDLADLDVGGQAGRLVDLLAPFGGSHRPWRHPDRGRGADAVQRRLREWSLPRADRAVQASRAAHPAANPSAGASVLYWAGHGWSDGTRAALAHGESPAAVGASGLEPRQLAQAIRARQALVERRGQARDAAGWAIVILETSHATQIADAVMAALHGPDAPGRLLLVAVPDAGTGLASRTSRTSRTSRFTDVLANLLSDTYRTERRILLRDLAAQLERLLGPGNVHQRALGDAAIVRIYPPAASWMSAPADTIHCLEDVLDNLSADERSHFAAKAQGAEHGELSWFFEGRQREIAQISAWLHRADSGLLVVAGRAGSGKSALLGTVLVRSLPGLRDALARRGLVVTTRSRAAMPPDSVFDAVIHLSGLDLAQAVRRTAAAAGIGPLPAGGDASTGVASELDFLTEELARRAQPFTVLADALDESLDPLDIARSLLARISALPGVRVLVGTRVSTNDVLDGPAGDENLLEALGERPEARSVLWVGHDRAAISRYVSGRLRAARDFGVAGQAVPHMREVSDQDIAQVAGEVAGTGQGFLFARLAVYELIADPRLLTPGRAWSRSKLLRGTHQDVFGHALHRLAGYDDRYLLLMRALSLARGRGVPEADGIWAIIAGALTPGQPSGPVSDAMEWAAAISGLLTRAAAYITADTSPGCGRSAGPGSAGPGTVYRLAHRTFVEYFDRYPLPGLGGGSSDLAARALIDAAGAAAAGARPMPDYLVKHLSGHVAEAGRWDDLGNRPDVLDRIDPAAVTADVIRTLFGRRAVPPSIAGIIGARDSLAVASQADRPGLRQLATTMHSPRHVIGEPVADWGVAASQAGRSTVHVALSGHAGTVNKVLSLTLPGGRVVLASSGDDGTIRLWDPVAATPVGVPMTGHAGTVDAICVLPAIGGATLLASAGSDGVRLWDPVSGRPAGPVFAGPAGPVLALCAVPDRASGRASALATAGQDGTVRLWDPATGQPVCPVITGHAGAVSCLCLVPGSPAVLASAGMDGTVRLWDPATGQPAGPVITGHTGPVWSICVVPGAEPGQPGALASAGEDGTVRLWDLASWRPADPAVLTGHTGTVLALCALPGREPGQSALLASAGRDGTVRLWNPASPHPVGPVISGHTGAVWALGAVPGREPGQPPILASGGEDRMVRLWDAASQEQADQPVAGHAGGIFSVCVIPGGEPGQPPVLAAAGGDGTVRLWDPATGQPAGPVITGHAGPVWSTCVVPGAQPGQSPVLATAGRDGTVRLWDPVTGQAAGPVIAGHAGPVWSTCVVPGAQPGQPPVLATAGGDGTVRFWDPATGQPAGPAIAGPVLDGSASAILAMCVVPGPTPALATAGVDGRVRLWDPRTGQPAGPATITAHAHAIWSMCVVPGQLPLLATAGEDGLVRLWDPVTGRSAGPVIAGHGSGAVYGLCVVPGGAPGQPAVLATAGNDGTVRLWDPVTGRPVGPVITGHAAPVRGVYAVPSGTPGERPWLASAGLDGTVRLWNAATGQPIGEPLVRSGAAVNSLAACADAIGDCVSLRADGRVRTWDAAIAGTRAVAAPPDVSVIANLTPADYSLLSGDIYGRVHHTDLRTGEARSSPVPVDRQAVLALCPLPGPTVRAAAAGGSGSVTVITISRDGRLGTGPVLRGPAGPIRALCPLTGPSGQTLLAAAGNDGAIWIWDLTAIDACPAGTGPHPAAETSLLTGHAGRIWSLAAVPAGAGRWPVLASAGADRTIRRWDPASGRALGPPLTGHTGQIRAIATATSHDGHAVLVSGGHDGSVRLWDPATGAPRAVIPLGIPVHALLQQDPDPASLERTSAGATMTVGLRTGILALDLHRHLFQPLR